MLRHHYDYMDTSIYVYIYCGSVSLYIMVHFIMRLRMEIPLPHVSPHRELPSILVLLFLDFHLGYLQGVSPHLDFLSHLSFQAGYLLYYSDPVIPFRNAICEGYYPGLPSLAVKRTPFLIHPPQNHC